MGALAQCGPCTSSQLQWDQSGLSSFISEQNRRPATCPAYYTLKLSRDPTFRLVPGVSGHAFACPSPRSRSDVLKGHLSAAPQPRCVGSITRTNSAFLRHASPRVTSHPPFLDQGFARTDFPFLLRPVPIHDIPAVLGWTAQSPTLPFHDRPTSHSLT